MRTKDTSRIQQEKKTRYELNCFLPGQKCQQRGQEWLQAMTYMQWKIFTYQKGGQVLVETGLAIGLPKGTYARIAPRSGLASKNRISVGGGAIDVDYTGEVKVILNNQGNEECLIQTGELMAQIIVEKIKTETAVQVKHLPKTDRGTQGFGRTDSDPKPII